MQVSSTGLNWTPESLTKRYAVLRKAGADLRLDLLYYPYWVIGVQGEARGRWFPPRFLEEVSAVDAREGKVYHIVGFPEVTEENIVEGSAVKVLPISIECQEAKERAIAGVLKNWTRKFSHPLRPRLEVKTGKVDILAVYKPFWIASGSPKPSGGFMVIDSTTGLAGLAEHKPIAMAWLALASTSQLAGNCGREPGF